MIAKKDGGGADDKNTGDAATDTERPGVEPADSAPVVIDDSASIEPSGLASVAMEEDENDVLRRGEKREREEEKEGDEEEEEGKESQSQPSTKRPRLDSKEPGASSSEAQQEAVEQQPSYAVNTGKESCKESKSLSTFS